MSRIRDDIAAGRISYGSWLVNPGPAAAESFARLGFGWVIVDLQHGGHSWESVQGIMPALELGGAQALVRVGWNEPTQIMRALDLGAVGVVVPCVSSAAEARTAAQAAHYPPLGQRSLGPVRQAYGGAVGIGGEAPLCFVMIESAAGLAAVDAIAATPGVDGLLLGPGDLAVDLGLDPTGDPAEQVMVAARRIAAACAAHGKIAAAASFTHGASVAFAVAGMAMLAVGSDSQFLAAGARLVLGRIDEIRRAGQDRIMLPDRAASEAR